MRKQNRRSCKRQGIEQIPTVHMVVATGGGCASRGGKGVSMKNGFSRLIVIVIAVVVLIWGIGLKAIEADSTSLPAVKGGQITTFARPSFDYSYAKSCTGSTITGIQGVIRIVQRFGNSLNSRIFVEMIPIQEILPYLFVFLAAVALGNSQPRRREIAILQYIHEQDGKK